jgi:hypothetical protein
VKGLKWDHITEAYNRQVHTHKYDNNRLRSFWNSAAKPAWGQQREAQAVVVRDIDQAAVASVTEPDASLFLIT